MNEYTDKINADDFEIESTEVIDSTNEDLTDDDPRGYIQVVAWIKFNLIKYGFTFQTTINHNYKLDTDLAIYTDGDYEINNLTAAVCDYYGKINNVEDDDNIADAMQWRIEEIIKEKSRVQQEYDDYIAENYTKNKAGQWVKK